MKKLMAILVGATASFTSYAGQVVVTFDIDDASRVEIGEHVNSTTTNLYDIHKGKNTFTIDDYTTIDVKAKDDCFLTEVVREVSPKHKEASAEQVYMLNYCTLWTINSATHENETYTIKTARKSTLRTASVDIDIDDASAVTIQMSGSLEEVPLVAGLNTVNFVPDQENLFVIMCKGNNRIYSVSLNDAQQTAKEDNFYWEVQVNDGDKLDIQVNWPDTPVTLKFDIHESADGYVTSVTYGGNELEGWKSGEVTVPLGKMLQFKVDNENFKFDSFKVDGVETDFDNYWSKLIRRSGTFAIAAHKWGEIAVDINIDDASRATVYRGNMVLPQYAIALTTGDNVDVMIDEKSPVITVASNEGFFVKSIFVDGSEVDNVEGSLWLSNNSKVVIETAPIDYDLMAVIYVDDVDAPELGYMFSSSLRTGFQLQSGYNLLPVSEKENPFTMNVMMGEAGYALLYLNNSAVNGDGDNRFSFGLANNDVLKLYAAAIPAMHTLTFENAGNVQAKAYVDKVIPLEASQTVLDGTEVDIEGADLAVYVNGVQLDAVADNKYVATVSSEGDTAILIERASGISSAECDGVVDTRIYNMQGIEVGQSLENLPAGIYISGCRKFIKK